MTAYYNEFDPFAAEWLRELIKAGHIAPGVVDTRSIEDVSPADLDGFTQCHFFVGIGVWSHALRSAGWQDDRPVWTGSCPCQPFSAAGKGTGFADERHLWPAFHHLIRIHRPVVVFGEQVASKDGLAWIDLVQADLENTGYTCGAVDSCAAGFGAPHIRQRMYWVGHAVSPGHEGRLGPCHLELQGIQRSNGPASETGIPCGMANAVCHGAEYGPRESVGQEAKADRADGGVQGERLRLGEQGAARGLADSKRDGGRTDQPERRQKGRTFDGRNSSRICGNGSASPTDGHWRDADWLLCRDGKWRPVEPCTFPLAHGAANRVGRLRGYGNAIVAPQAQAFVEAFLESQLMHD